MSWFDRLKRLARAEINEIKRVLADRDDGGAPGGPDGKRGGPPGETDRERAIREAEEELARAEHDVLAAEIDAGASLWGAGAAGPVAEPASSVDIERGAALWGAAGDEEPARVEPVAKPYESRTHAFPREVRDAYAALEIPLGADRETVERAFREMLHRYHPDKHAGDARREELARDLTIRINDARHVLHKWLEGRP